MDDSSIENLRIAEKEYALDTLSLRSSLKINENEEKVKKMRSIIVSYIIEIEKLKLIIKSSVSSDEIKHLNAQIEELDIQIDNLELEVKICNKKIEALKKRMQKFEE
jgi:hypothetical protein